MVIRVVTKGQFWVLISVVKRGRLVVISAVKKRQLWVVISVLNKG